MPFAQPSKRRRFRTLWVEGTAQPRTPLMGISGMVLLLAATAATLAIGFREPRADYAYEFIVFILAAGWCLSGQSKFMPWAPGLTITALGAWGLFQLAMDGTVYRHATVVETLRLGALAATAWVSFQILRSEQLRVRFLRTFACFGSVIAVISVLAYFTSPGKILWIFDAPYPDVWGCFLSRNNFAQFLELAMPAALWLALRESDKLYLCLAAVMLASGLASASRAGACILLLEAVVMLWAQRRSSPAVRMALRLFFATAVLAVIPGIGTLTGRFRESDPFQIRREIAHSAVAMISARPWTGFGLGTFSTVYPEYAEFDIGQSVDHAHNDWLEWGAEGGVGFAAVWMSLAIWAARPAIRTGWGIGVLGCFLHALVDYPLARLGVAAWMFILLGMLAATDLRE